MCARSCAWKVGHSTRQKLERSERAIAAVDCHSSPAGAGREIGRVASFRAAALAMPARKSASLLAQIRHRATHHRRDEKPPGPNQKEKRGKPKTRNQAPKHPQRRAPARAAKQPGATQPPSSEFPISSVLPVVVSQGIQGCQKRGGISLQLIGS